MAQRMRCAGCRICGESKLYHETGEIGHGFRLCGRDVIEERLTEPVSYGFRHKTGAPHDHLPQPDYVS